MRIPLGQKIKKLRELKNLTQEHVADKLDITQSNYSKMEMGKLDIPFSKLEEIASVLSMPVESVISFNDNLIFNMKGNRKANGLVINQVSMMEKRLYDDYIDSLKKYHNLCYKIVRKKAPQNCGAFHFTE